MDNLRLASLINRLCFRKNAADKLDIDSEQNNLIAEFLDYDPISGLSRVRYLDGSIGFTSPITTGTIGTNQPVTIKSVLSPIPKIDSMPTRRRVVIEPVATIEIQLTPIIRLFAVVFSGSIRKLVRCVGDECSIVDDFSVINAFPDSRLILSHPNASTLLSGYSSLFELRFIQDNNVVYLIQKTGNFADLVANEISNEWSNLNFLFYYGNGYFSSRFRPQQTTNQITTFATWAYAFSSPSEFVEYLINVIPSQQQSRDDFQSELESISTFYSTNIFPKPSYSIYKNYTHSLPFPASFDSFNLMTRIGSHSYNTFVLGSETLILNATMTERFICKADIVSTNQGTVYQDVDISRVFEQRFFNPTSSSITYTENKNNLVYKTDASETILDTSGDWIWVSSQQESSTTSNESPQFIFNSAFSSGSYTINQAISQQLNFAGLSIGDTITEFNGMSILNFVNVQSVGRGIVRGTITSTVVTGFGVDTVGIQITVLINEFIQGINECSFRLIQDGHPYCFFMSRACGFTQILSNYSYYWSAIAPSIVLSFYASVPGQDEPSNAEENLRFSPFIKTGMTGYLSQDIWIGDTIKRLANKVTPAGSTEGFLETWQIQSGRIVFVGSELVQFDSCQDSLNSLGDITAIRTLGSSIDVG